MTFLEMWCKLPLKDFREYSVLDGAQKWQVQRLLWDYYRLAYHEAQGHGLGEAVDSIEELMAQDLAELANQDEFEVCQLLKDTIDNSEQILTAKLRRNRKDGRKNL